MACSMTGIGEGRITRDGYDIHVLVKGVNHRFLNLQIRTPRGYNRFEPRLREIISKRVFRGKVDVFVEFYELPSDAGEIILNRGLCENYAGIIQELSEKLEIPTGLTGERLLKITDGLTVIPQERHDMILMNYLQEVLELALENYDKTRTDEGAALISEMGKYVDLLKSKTAKITELSESQVSGIRDRLKESLEQLSKAVQADEKRLEQEVVYWAIKADISEELTRLETHLIRLEKLLDKKSPMGKECDFIIQEIHREVNTIGSKSVLVEINEMVVTMKLYIEKLREQAQNLE